MDRVLPAPASLADLVESISIQERDLVPDGSAVGRVVPTGTVELIFTHGARLAHVDGEHAELMPRHYVTGQRTRPVRPRIEGTGSITLVSLLPWGLHRMLPTIAGETDVYADLRQLVPRSRMGRFEDRFDASDDVDARVAAVVDLLVGLRDRLHDRSPACSPVVRAAVARFTSAPHLSSVGPLADELGVSRRHLTRRFTTEIGVPPKRFARIMRFQRALAISGTNERGWADVAMRCGYSDQSHLTHEFGDLSGLTPQACRRAPARSNDAFNGGRVSDFFHTVYL